MRGSPRKHNDKKDKPLAPADLPDLVTTCPKCGGEIGLWSNEEETVCVFCQFRIFEKERTTH